MEFDVESLARQLSQLDRAALECFLDQCGGEIGGLPFDIGVRDFAPAPVAGCPDKVIVGLNLTARFKSASAA